MGVEEAVDFEAWLKSVPDLVARAAVVKRIGRLADDNPGDAGPIGEGVSELRVHVGAGWRIYFVRRAGAYVLLCGGSKRTQQRDIARALAPATEV